MLEKLTDMGDVRGMWPQLRPWLLDVASHSKDKWVPEDVYSAIQSGVAHLYVNYVRDTVEGLLVLTFSQGYEGRECHVWCAYNRAGRENTAEEDRALERIASEEKCRYLTFFSPRPGWSKMAPVLGWEKVHTLYRKEVTK